MSIDPRERDRVRNLLDLDRHVEAREILTRLLASDPEDVELLALFAQALHQADDHVRALEVGNRIVALTPEDEYGHRMCAIALSGMDQHDEAVRAAAEAVRNAPNYWLTHLTLAQVAIGARKQGVLARGAATRALELAPHEPDAHFIHGMVLHSLQHHEAAKAAYREALALQPDHAMALNNLAVLEGGMRIAKSARSYSEALTIDPQSKAPRQNLDAVASRFMRRFYWASLAALVVGALAVAAPADFEGTSQPGIASYLVVAVLLGGGASYAVTTIRSLPPSVTSYVRSRLVGVNFVAATLWVSVITALTAVLVCVNPLPVGSVGLAIQAVGMANLALFVASFARESS